MRLDQIALQLFTVRRLAAVDLPGTLRAVAAAGYRAVELAGLPDTAPGELALHLEQAGLTAVASHEGIQRLRDDPMAVAARLHAVGCRRIVVPSMPEEDRRTVAGVRRFAAEVGELAETFAPMGFQLAYHNHAFEFAPLEGTTIWDVLLAELPTEVELELDVYWVSVGGRDPATTIGSLAGRARLLHVKDRAPGPEPRDCPPGEGILAIPEIIGAAGAAGVEWYITELVDTSDPVADIVTAARYLESLAR